MTEAGKVAIITGGASGIGRALGEELARRGADVVLADRQLDLAAEAADAIGARGGLATAMALDVRDFDQQLNVVEATVERAGRVDYFFNNAGVAIGGPAERYEREDWDDSIDVNIRGVAYGVQAVLPTMEKQGFGHIINTASVAGLMTTPSMVGYVTSKHAVVGMSKALRVELARLGIRVTALCPGAINTPILKGGKFGRLKLLADDEVLDKLLERTRPMDVDEFAVEVLNRLRKNPAFLIVPRRYQLMTDIERLAPRLALFLSQKIYERVTRDLEAAEASRSRAAANGASAETAS